MVNAKGAQAPRQGRWAAMVRPCRRAGWFGWVLVAVLSAAPAARAQPADERAPATAGPAAAPAAGQTVPKGPGPGPDEADANESRPSRNSFGAELMMLAPEVTVSGYGDAVLSFGGAAPTTFDSSHFNPIFSARMGERLNAELEIEVERDVIRAEYAFFDVSPTPDVIVRIGKFLVPLGQFNEVLHPSFRWAMISRPLMFDEVIPAVWSDLGVQVKGSLGFGRGRLLEYSVYVVNGLASQTPPPGSGSTEGSNAQFVHNARSRNTDNNDDKAVGGSLSLSLLAGRRVGATTLGVSTYTGAIDARATRRLSIVDADFRLRLGNFELSGELAQSFLSGDGRPSSSFERGAYVRLAYMLEHLDFHLRWDNAQVRLDDGRILVRQRVVGAIRRSFSAYWSLRVEGEWPVPGPARGEPMLSTMVAFSF